MDMDNLTCLPNLVLHTYAYYWTLPVISDSVLAGIRYLFLLFLCA